MPPVNATGGFPMTKTILDGDEFLTAEQVSDLLAVSERTLSRWNRLRCGPPRIKIGRIIFYRRSSVHEWLRSVEQPSG